jgi:tRNA-splicing ligase RtcB
VHNHHNYAWREEHGGESYWVVRKGATPARPGQRGFVGSSMGEASVILEGVESERSADALYSTVHGAGRAMSRTAATGRRRRGKQRTPGLIDWPAVLEGLRARGIELRGGAADEAPGAYKRLDEVLAEHAGTVRVLHTLTPLGVAMAGEHTVDPYKD